MRNCDDSDMKIVRSYSDVRRRVSDEAEAARLFEQQRDNGNLAKARRLGATLADRVDCIATDGGSAALSDKIECHKKILMIFAIVVGIEEYLDERLLIRTALNVFYDSLKKEKPLLYDAMSSSGAFSFYYLEYRRGGDRSANVAQAFAMLCGDESSSPLHAVGKEYFSAYFGYVQALIDEMSFA